MKKLNACALKIEEGIKALKDLSSSKALEYTKELAEIRATLTKVEKKYANQHSTSWWEWVLVFAISYWWVPIVAGVVIYVLIKFL